MGSTHRRTLQRMASPAVASQSAVSSSGGAWLLPCCAGKGVQTSDLILGKSRGGGKEESMHEIGF